VGAAISKPWMATFGLLWLALYLVGTASVARSETERGDVGLQGIGVEEAEGCSASR